VRLAQYGQDKLISRSQSKRLVAWSRGSISKRFFFDFEGVETIGQAFADEIFRVFAKRHPQIEVIAVNANPEIQAGSTRPALTGRPMFLGFEA
jgi:STAS-like domain of unknown function (DUF4325)